MYYKYYPQPGKNTEGGPTERYVTSRQTSSVNVGKPHTFFFLQRLDVFFIHTPSISVHLFHTGTHSLIRRTLPCYTRSNHQQTVLLILTEVFSQPRGTGTRQSASLHHSALATKLSSPSYRPRSIALARARVKAKGV